MSNIYDGAFFTSVKSYFKSIPNSIKLSLSSIFYTIHAFVKKCTTLKTLGEKVLTIDFFEIQIVQWNGTIN